MIKAKVVSITGSPLVDGWSGFISNQDQTLICSLAVKGENAKNIGHEISLEIKKSQPDSIGHLHNLLLDTLSKLRDQQAQLQLALLWLPESIDLKTNQSNSQLMVLAAYQGKIILKRENKMGKVIESDTGLKIIQGSIKNNDEIILSTQQAAQIEQSLRHLLKSTTSHVDLRPKIQEKINLLIDSSLTSIGLVKLKTIEEKVVNIAPKEKVVTSSQSNNIEQTSKEQLLQTKERPKKIDINHERYSDQSTSIEQNINRAQEPQKIEEEEKKKKEKEIKIKISFKPIFLSIKEMLRKYIIKLASWIKKVYTSSKKKLKSREKKSNHSSLADNVPAGNNQSNPASSFTSSPSYLQIPQKFIKKALNIFSNRGVYLETKSSKKNLKRIYLIVLLIIFVVGSVLFIKKYIEAQQIQAQNAIQPALNLLDEAKNTMDHDIVLSRDKTAEAIEIMIAEQKELEHQRFTQRYFEKNLEEAREFYTEISGLIEVAQLDIFFDLREISSNFLISRAVINNQNLFLLDKEERQIINLEINSKQANKIHENDQEIRDMAASDDQLFLLSNGIHSLNVTQIESFPGLTELKNEGDSDRDALFINQYQGYLYVFNPSKRNIYRYIIREEGLSEPIGWLTNKQNIKFDQITSVAIDGRIWLSDNTGSIIKLERGEPIEFNISGLEESLGNSIRIYADATTSFLYVLDPQKSRVVILSDEGDFIKQITSPSLASVTEMIVNEQEEQIYAISGSIVYLVNLE